MCGKVCAQKTRLRAGKPAGKAWLSPGFLTRPGSRSCARSSHCPASLSHGPTGPWEPFPPAWPGKARPCQGSALRTACTPPQRRALTRRKTGGQSLAFSGSLTHPGCAGHLHIAPTVAPILTAAPYRNTILKTYKIYTGAHRCAPYRSTFRNPLSLFPAHTPSPSPRIPERLLLRPYRCDFACKRMVWRTLWANMTRVRWAGLPPRLALRQAETGFCGAAFKA